jgi:hypothetical protein
MLVEERPIDPHYAINAKWTDRRRRKRAGLPPVNSIELQPISRMVLDGRS